MPSSEPNWSHRHAMAPIYLLFVAFAGVALFVLVAAFPPLALLLVLLLFLRFRTVTLDRLDRLESDSERER
ncbi:hypothetical protein [Halogranum rubrum]|nr:hypothetical protein [Halogranum salarium]